MTADTASLSRRTATAAQWQFLSLSVQGIIQFGVGVLLARLLPPEDFGLLALALIVVGFAGLFSNLGLSPALVQRRELTERHIRVGFTGSFLLGLGVTAALVATAPLSTLVFPEPELPLILTVVSFTFAIRGVGNVAGALLQRELNYRAIFVVFATGYLIGYALVAVTMALLGFGVWSLVGGFVCQSIVETALMVVIGRHPMRPLLARRELRDLLGMGVGFNLSGVLLYFGENGDRFVIGRYLGDGPLGLYTRAYALMKLPQAQITRVVGSVLLPAFAKIQDEPKALGRAFIAASQFVTLSAGPVLAGMLVAAPHMIVGLYGPKWAGAVAPFQILAAFGLFRVGYPLSRVLANATGKVYQVTGVTVVYGVVVVAGSLYAVPFGIEGVAFAVGVAVATMFFGMTSLALRIAHITWVSFLTAQLPAVFVTAIVGISAFLARALLESLALPSLVILALLMAVCAIVLGATLHWLPRRLRPDSLYGRLDQVMTGWPRKAQSVVRRLIRLPAASCGNETQ